jgi:hypothetical protein
METYMGTIVRSYQMHACQYTAAHLETLVGIAAILDSLSAMQLGVEKQKSFMRIQGSLLGAAV